ncbi:rod-binding protein [Burkholderia gladioli]|uniref:rod-binding protein n=1 Tax=Burkholderia gladioli TaxID=28095 RepID=UPI001641D91B|nr:rod-binding protein [Burkholderia gladioli]
MTNNTTAPALTDEQRSRVEYALDYMGGSGFAPEADILRALLTSPRAAVPGQGWKLVPEIPTVEMLDAALPGDDTFGRGFKTRIYQEMLDAAPAAPAAPVEDVAPNVVEAIAEQWDGCMYAAPGIDIDIGEAIRAAAKRLDTAPAAPVAPVADNETTMQECVSVLLDRTEAAEADAFRYRFLRDRPLDTIKAGGVFAGMTPENVVLNGADLDAAIDAASGVKFPVAAQAVAADGGAEAELLQLDVLLANLHAAVWHAGAGDDGPVDYDMAGKAEAKAIQRHVRTMLASRAAVSPATADEPAALDPAVLAVVESLSDANQPGNIKAQISYLMARVREDVLTHDGKMGGNTVLAENRLHALIGLAIRGARASQTAAPQANVAGERAAFVEKLRELGADISPLGSRDERLCITSNIMVDDVLAAARASQAAAPAEAREPSVIGYVPTYVLDELAAAKNINVHINRTRTVDHDAALYAGRVPADAGEAVARPTSFHFHRFVNGQEMAEDVLIERATTIEAAIKEAVRICPKRPMTVLVHAPAWVGALHGGTLATPVAPAEAVAPVVAALRKLVHLKSLKDGADRCVPGYIEDRIEYQRDKPKAWEDARAALASFDAAQGAQGGKGGDRG